MTSHFQPTTGLSEFADDVRIACASLVHVPQSINIQSGVTEDEVRALLEGGADVNCRYREGRTPIMVAAGKGILRIMQILMDHGADLCAQDKRGKTALMMAICAGRSENVKFLLQFTDKQNFLNLRDSKGQSALSLAVTYVELDIAKEIIRRGANVNLQDTHGDTPLLHWLFKFFNTDVEFLRNILAAGSDVNQQNNNGLSPLMMAASNFTSQPLQFMVSSGATVTINYLETNSSLLEWRFMVRPNFQLMRTAFGSGFDPSGNSYDVCRKLLSTSPNFEQTITIFLEAGADVNAVSKNNGTKTALSFLPSVTYRGTTTIFCMDAFLDKFARSSWVNPVVLQEPSTLSPS